MSDESIYDEVYRESVHDWLDEREPRERPDAQELAEDERELERERKRKSSDPPTERRA